MSLGEINSTRGLPGLRTIREFLLGAHSLASLASSADVTPDWLTKIETGKRDCTQALQRRIAHLLACNPADLLSEPSEQRLKEIRAAYLRAQADQAEAELAPGKAVGL